MRLFFLFLICLSSSLTANELVDIKSVVPKIHVENRCLVPYGYPAQVSIHSSPIYLDEYAALRLRRVEDDLSKLGLGLIIYAGYRSPLTQILVNANQEGVSSEAIEADAAHYRKGLGVDVAIYYLDGQPLHLPSEYGEKSPRALRDYPYLKPHAYHNSLVLQNYMRKHGFISQPENWWHFDLKGWEESPNLDIEI